ncbi:hypothetical protein RvY_16453 [Ramazzottius varieornatus]|uniref:Uncharacterized protein n=1 Tax=Ramazzottius varieornatus TaxID=947166 RepID=A0A1D1W621_RAMVA|nr:hypothetical protein RvY_16453 [Ramazzottius varieornatus]
MLGNVIGESLNNSSVDPNDGSALGRLFWNRTFNLDTGVVQFDEVGERKQDMIVQHFQKGDVWPTIVLKLPGSTNVFESVTTIEWPVPFPPPSEPFCGYTGIKPVCLSREDDYPLHVIVRFGSNRILLDIDAAMVWSYFGSRELANIRDGPDKTAHFR